MGLTGGIGAGKTAVSNYFSKLGVSVVDADVIARQLVAQGSACLEEIKSHFGETILLEDGSLNREQLRELIFKDAQQKHWLEQLIHPHVHARIKHALARAKSPYTLLASPLLLETQQRSLVDRVLVVDVPFELQVSRTGMRDDVNDEQTRKIIASQISREQRLAAANDIIDNTGELVETYRQAHKLHELYLALAKKSP